MRARVSKENFIGDDSEDEGLYEIQSRKAPKTSLSRDQLSGILLYLVVVIGGSRFSYWFIIWILDAFCIAFDLSCKPEGY